MTATLFGRIVIPVASEEDARNSAASVIPRLGGGGGEVLAVHVVEKAGGAPDKASVEQRDQRAREMLAVVEETLDLTDIDVETEILYGTNVAETILDAADEFDASAVVFTPRGGSRWVKLLTGDTADELIRNADRPVVILPDEDDPADGEAEPADDDRTGEEGPG